MAFRPIGSGSGGGGGGGSSTANFTVLTYTSGAYPSRPSTTTNPAGTVRFVGPVQPSTWLAGDEWVDNS